MLALKVVLAGAAPRADPGVRRGRCRHRRRHRRGGRRAAGAAGGAGAGAAGHPQPAGGGARGGASARRQAGGARAAPRRGSSRSTARRGARRSPACWPANASPRRPAPPPTTCSARHEAGRAAHRGGGERPSWRGWPTRSRTPTAPITSATRRDHRRRIRRAAPAQYGDRGAVSGPGPPRFALAARRRRAGGRIRQGAARRADAVAGQCVRRRRIRRVLRPRPPLPRARSRTPRCASSASRRSTGCRSTSPTRTARFVRGATRGDGTEGEDVTANLRTIASRAAPPARATRRRGSRSAARCS